MEAYEQKIYTMLINYQFQVASHGCGCLWLICPQSILRTLDSVSLGVHSHGDLGWAQIHD